MIVISKNQLQQLFGILLMVALTACGNSSSSPTTVIPSSATVFYAHNLVFRNSTTLSTGYNAFGQLGNDSLKSRSTPGTLDQYYPFAGLTTGGNHSVAFFNNSTVRCWGYNIYGQLGDNTTTYRKIPAKTVDISGIKAVAAGAYHTLALQSNDTLWSWGRNEAGQLGVGDLSSAAGHSNVPVQIGNPGSTFVNISSVAANGNYSLARADGKVWSWGSNSSEQLGRDTMIVAQNVPAIVDGLPSADISSIAAGGAFGYAVTKDGTLWAWGNNNTGQLGIDPKLKTKSQKPVQIFSKNVIKVAAGIQHGLALLDDRTVRAWGYNRFGQLGNGITVDSHVPVKVDLPLPLTSEEIEIRAFGSSSMAKVDGVWYVWGDNSHGQLGSGVSVSVKKPRKMAGF